MSGIIEGFAYRRLQSDTRAAGETDTTGMSCINNWFFSGDGQPYLLIEAAMERYPDEFPAVLVSVLIQRECGE